MQVGDYVILKVVAGNALEETYLNPANLPAPGQSVVIQHGNILSHVKDFMYPTEGDYTESVSLINDRWPFIHKKRFNGQNWIPETFCVFSDELRPSLPVIFDLSNWVNENILPVDGHLPDKGMSFEFDIQFWMNHYHNDTEHETVYHRSLTASKVLRMSMLKTNSSNELFVPSELKELHFTGAHCDYDSWPVVYNQVMHAGPLYTNAFPVTIDLAGSNYRLKIENNLITEMGFESINWRVAFMLKAKATEFSMIDRTNTIV